MPYQLPWKFITKVSNYCVSQCQNSIKNQCKYLDSYGTQISQTHQTFDHIMRENSEVTAWTIPSIIFYLQPAIFEDFSHKTRIPLGGCMMVFEKFHHCLYFLEGDNTAVTRCQLNCISGTCDASWLTIQLISTFQDIIGLNIVPVLGRYLPNFLGIQKLPTGHFINQLFVLDLPLLLFEWIVVIYSLG